MAEDQRPALLRSAENQPSGVETERSLCNQATRLRAPVNGGFARVSPASARPFAPEAPEER